MMSVNRQAALPAATRKIAYRYRAMSFALVMSGCTALIVSGIIMSMHLPWDGRFAPAWLHAYFTAWPIVFIAIIVIAPRVNRLLDLFVESGDQL